MVIAVYNYFWKCSGTCTFSKYFLEWTVSLLINQYAMIATQNWSTTAQLDDGRLGPTRRSVFWCEIVVAANSLRPRNQTNKVDVKRKSCFLLYETIQLSWTNDFHPYLWCSLYHKLIQTISVILFFGWCTSLEWKERAFMEKISSRCFFLFPAAILVHQNGTPIWRPHTKLYKGAWNVSANNSEAVGHKDMRLGQTVYKLVFYNISFSCLLSLDGFQFIFLLRDSENDLYRNR